MNEKITSVEKLIEITNKIYKDEEYCKIQNERCGYLSLKKPFGIWFRGQPETTETYHLEPAIFRKYKNSSTLYDENSMFTHAKLRLASYRDICRDDFDWLCLMQHHGIPTRIMDWSESSMIALFFLFLTQKMKRKKMGS